MDIADIVTIPRINVFLPNLFQKLRSFRINEIISKINTTISTRKLANAFSWYVGKNALYQLANIFLTSVNVTKHPIDSQEKIGNRFLVSITNILICCFFYPLQSIEVI